MASKRVAIALLLVLSGCGGLRMERYLRQQEDDWPTFARGATRTAVASSQVTPPLTLAWEQDVTAGVGNGSPVIVDSVVFVTNLRGELYAIAARTGRVIGWVGLGDAIQGSPVVDGSTVFMALSNTRESLVAYDLFEGKVRWKKNFGDIETSPLLYDQHLYIGNISGQFFCVHRGSGDEVWKFELPANKTLKGIRSSAAADSGTVVFGADDGWIFALRSGSGALLWKFNTGAPVSASPLIDGGMVIVGNRSGEVIALARSTGSLLWRCDTRESIVANAVPAGECVVVGTLAGTALGLRTRDGQQLWRTSLSGPISAGGAVAGTTVFVGTLRKQIYALDAGSGRVIWNESADGRIRTSPAAAFGHLYIATDEHSVLAYREAAQ
ncbi:MAG: PQQ-binding-like beta-propeller repeat protein [Bacteroidota bacterium]